MPGFDRSGPMGGGPMTGRGLGLCTGTVKPGDPVYSTRGFAGRGGGRGNRFRNMYYATGLPYWARGGAVQPTTAELSREDELNMMKTHADNLQRELDAAKQRITTLEKGNKK